jgi:hypothetical protein
VSDPKARPPILFVGDVHGNVDAVADIDIYAQNVGACAVVSVGDFGVLWRPDPLKKYFDKRGRQGKKTFPWITCGGNHEHWVNWFEMAEGIPNDQLVELAPACFFAQRGSVHKIGGRRIAFLGGAESTDKAFRTEGRDWWPQESPTRVDFERFFDSLETGPEIVVTHDCPTEAGDHGHPDRADQPTPKMLQRCIALTGKRPRLWAYGHHHNTRVTEATDVRGTTTYACTGLEGQGYRLNDDNEITLFGRIHQ